MIRKYSDRSRAVNIVIINESLAPASRIAVPMTFSVKGAAFFYALIIEKEG